MCLPAGVNGSKYSTIGSALCEAATGVRERRGFSLELSLPILELNLFYTGAEDLIEV